MASLLRVFSRVLWLSTQTNGNANYPKCFIHSDFWCNYIAGRYLYMYTETETNPPLKDEMCQVPKKIVNTSYFLNCRGR